MRQTPLLAMTLACVIGCNQPVDGQQADLGYLLTDQKALDPSTAIAIPYAVVRTSERLGIKRNVQVVTADNGFRTETLIKLVVYDRKMETPCAFGKAVDGMLRCLPVGQDGSLKSGNPTYYLDDKCAATQLWIDVDPKVKFAAVYQKDSGTYKTVRVSPTSPSKIYQFDQIGPSCREVSNSFAAYSIDAEIPPDQFQAGKMEGYQLVD